MNSPSIILKRLVLPFPFGATCFLVSLAVFFFVGKLSFSTLAYF